MGGLIPWDGSGRTSLPWRERRELDRVSRRLDAAAGRHQQKIDLAVLAVLRESLANELVGRVATTVAQQGPIERALTEDTLTRYKLCLDAAAYRLASDLDRL